jgi:hypothetical protein
MTPLAIYASRAADAVNPRRDAPPAPVVAGTLRLW